MSAITLTKAPAVTFTATGSLAAWIGALKVAKVGIGTRPPVPVLSGVKITVSAGVVSATGFDYETEATSIVAGASGYDGGMVVVSHKLLLDLLTTAGKRATKRVSDTWTVTMKVDGNKLVVEVNGAEFNLATLPAEEYPHGFANDADTRSVRVEAGLFIRRMDSAMVSASTDDTLPVLTSIKFEVEHGTMALLATDRYRLTLAELSVEGSDVDAGFGFLLRAKTWKMLKRVLNAKGGAITVTSHGEGSNTRQRLTIAQGDVSVSSLSVDGDYPKIRSLFPDNTPIVFEADADQLAACVAQVAVTAERNTPVRFTYNGIDSLRVDAGTGEDAQAQAFLPYSSPIGNRGFAVAFNPHYIGEALKDLKGQRIQIMHTTAPKPALIKGVDSDEVQHLIMPVRLP